CAMSHLDHVKRCVLPRSVLVVGGGKRGGERRTIESFCHHPMKVLVGGGKCRLAQIIVKLCQLCPGHVEHVVAQFSLGPDFVPAELTVFCSGSFLTVQVFTGPAIAFTFDKRCVVMSVDYQYFHRT